jgi:outer membrane protein
MARCFAQEEFSLKQSIDYALEHSPQIKIAQNKIKKAELRLAEQGRRLDFDISVHYGYSPLADKTGMSFGFTQDLEKLLGANKNQIKQAELDLDTAIQEYIIVKDELIKQVCSAYYQLEDSRSSCGLKEKELALAQKSWEFAQEKFNLGRISLNELLNCRKRLWQAEYAKSQCRSELEKASLKFYKAIGKQD